jgi:hypothetical protein
MPDIIAKWKEGGTNETNKGYTYGRTYAPRNPTVYPFESTAR